MNSYPEIKNRSWAELLAEDWGGYPPPLTVHLPIQPVHSRDLIHVDCGLNVCRRRVVPGLNCEDGTAFSAVRRSRTLLVQFALGDPPQVPDFRRSALALDEGRYPLVRASFNLPDERFTFRGLFHEFEYFVSPTGDPEQHLLWIGGTVTNDLAVPKPAHVWVKVNFPIEEDLFDYHYIPFYWDATKYPPCPGMGLRQKRIFYRGQCIGRIVPGSFDASWAKAARFKDTDFQKLKAFALPHLRLKTLRDAIHFQAKLPPGEKRDFQLAILTNFETVTSAHLKELHRANPNAGRKAAKRHFVSLAPTGMARLTCAAGRWEELFAHLPISIAQLLIDPGDGRSLIPIQGGSSERHFVWIWEAVHMLTPLLQLGHFAPVRKALDFIFSLQDGGCPPKGRLTSIKGAVGTTGPKWLNTTGGALALAVEYYRYSHDAAFLAAFLSKIRRAMDWIVGEIRATRKLSPDGRRPLTYGLMPFGCGTDGDTGHIVALTDAYTFCGLEKAVELLEQLKHAEAAGYRRELEQYRRDLAAAVKGMARPDGFIERAIVTGDPEEVIFRGFDNICGAFNLAFGNAVDIRSARFRKYVDYFERHLADGCFIGKMDRDVRYIGVGEWIWQDLYLRLGEWKKAFAAVQINLKYGMTPDAHQTQERFSIHDPAFCPWQPNGSGNGRVLDMILKSFYFEDGGRVTLLGGIPFAWLRSNRITALRNLHTTRGILNLEARMRDGRRCEVRLSANSVATMPQRIRFPDHFAVTTQSMDRPRERRFILTDREER